MANHDIIAIGGSTGSLDALKQIFADLPADFPAAVLVVRHIGSDSADMLARILNGVGRFPVKTAAEGDVVEIGHGYVGPAARHLLVVDGIIRLGRGPRENMVRAGDRRTVSLGCPELRTAGHRRGAVRTAG